MTADQYRRSWPGLVTPALAFMALRMLLGALGLDRMTLSAALLGFAAILFAIEIPGRDRSRPAIPAPRLIAALALGAASGVLLGALTAWAARRIPALSAGAPEGPSSFPAIAALCLMAPMAEELIYRGIVQRRVRNRLGPVPAILLAAALFAAAHRPLAAMPLALAAGLLFGLLALRLGLIAAIAAHAAANGAQLLPGSAALWLGICAAALLIAALFKRILHCNPYGGGNP